MAIVIRTPKDLGAAIRQARRDLGLSQHDLARQAHVSRPWISELEHGKRTAELGLVLRILHTVDLTVAISGSSSSTPDDPTTGWSGPVGTRIDLDDNQEPI